MGADFVSLSLPPLLIGVLVAVSCALPGLFLTLRRQALLGDAISHVVLPGIVVAFLFTGALATIPVLVGSAVTAIAAVALIEAIKRLGRVEPGAAMGVAFTSLFAAGVLLLEQTDTSSVHLDVEHALYGNLESLVWLDGQGWGSLLDPAALAALPAELTRIAVVCLVTAFFVGALWRPLKISTFDEGFAVAVGIPVRLLGLALAVLAAVAAVASFDAVGSIIVIAMFICPPAAARLMTNSLERQVAWTIAFAAGSATLGYVLAGYGPLWLGAQNSVSAAGMIAAVSGLLLGVACVFGPCRTRAGKDHAGLRAQATPETGLQR